MILDHIQEGSGPAVVLLHGVGSDASVWAPQARRLAQAGHRAIALHMPGYAGGPRMERPDLDDLAATCWQTLDALGVDAAHLVGLSLGSVLAVAMADRRPRRAMSLTLANGFVRYPDGAATASRIQALASAHGMAHLAAARSPAVLGSASQHLVPEVQSTMAGIPRDAFLAMTQLVWTADVGAAAARTRAPTTIVSGAQDTITPPRLQDELEGLIAGSRRVTLATGHLSSLEAPDAFTAAILTTMGAA